MDAATFAEGRDRRFGTANPTRMDVPFWHHMVRTGESAYEARSRHDPGGTGEGEPWCFRRFGQTRTRLPDGRVVCVGGEHEDHYDPDFCIFNDVVVTHPDGRLEIFGYPKDVFPPTDFHTATLCGDRIVLVGGLGYAHERGGDRTPVFALDVATFAVERLATTGPSPGWIYKHRTDVSDGRRLRVSGGQVVRGRGREQSYADHAGAAELDLATLAWREVAPPERVKRPRPEWPEPWDALGTGDAFYHVGRLLSEAPPGHPLYAGDVEAVAEDTTGGRVLFRLTDGSGRVAVVRLGYAEHVASLPDPPTVVYSGLDDWLRAANDADERAGGPTPR